MFDLVRIIEPGSGAAAIAAQVELAIGDGRLGPGSQLPPIRELADALGVSPATVAAAYRSLGRRGLVNANRRRGTAVAAQPPLRVRRARQLPAGVRDLARGNPDQALLPPLAPVLARLDAKPVLYGGPAVLPTLLDAAKAAFAADGIAGDVGVTSGALDGVERVLEAHLRPGDAVAVEDPVWPRITDLVVALGLRPEPVPVDDRGFVPGALALALDRGARAVIAVPRGQNPTGAALDGARGAQLRSLLEARPEVLVVEDDYVAQIAGAPYVPLHGTTERYAVVRSLSKVLGPDLRIALVAGDSLTMRRLEGRQLLGPGWVSHLLQQLAARLLASAATRRLLARAERVYAERRSALVDALGEHGIAAHGPSGLGVWVPLEEEAPVVDHLLAHGFAVGSGERFRIASGPGVRVTTTTLEPADAARLASLIAEATTSTSTYAA
jgi:DNA-binding transcriptional MocR family regulator